MIYFDNSATTFPKPKIMINAMADAMTNYIANPGRSGHKLSIKSSEMVYNVREIVSDFFSLNNPTNVIFTHNATYGLNMVIKGVLKNGDHVICTPFEHNSVLRPLNSISGIEISYINSDSDGEINVDEIENLIKPNTKLFICMHASNVTGNIFPIYKIGEICKKHNILFLVDASQSAGYIDIDIQKNIDFLVCPGHKGLYGPMGTGIVCINCDFPLKTIIEGGTGTNSKSLDMGDEYPERLESGTLNVPGIIGLGESIKYISKIGIDNIYQNEMKLIKYMSCEMNKIEGIKILGTKDLSKKVPIVSFVLDKKDSTLVSRYLDEKYSICVRGLYHCAYGAHRAIGSEKNGATRVSLGMFNTKEEVETFIYALKYIIKL